MKIRNLFNNIPKQMSSEHFESIIATEDFNLERIISRAHATPAGEWYDQEKDEWVMVLQGNAALSVEGESQPVVLKPGDSIHLPAHLKHRVEWTDAAVETIWLALHFHANSA